MTIGISKERLEKMKDNLYGYQKDYELIESLIEECTELNQSRPIDEDTPKDRELLLFWSNGHKDIGYSHFMCGQDEQPTHYQELPADLK